MSERKTYTDEFKREAVRLCEERGNISAVARDLGIDHGMLRNWKRRLVSDSAKPFPGNGNPRNAEMAELKRELARLQEDNAILKKAVGIFTKGPK